MEFEDDDDQIVLSELIKQIRSGKNLCNNTDLSDGDQEVKIKEEPPVEIIDVLQDDCGLYETETTDRPKVKWIRNREKHIRYTREYSKEKKLNDTADQHAARLAVEKERYHKRKQNETTKERSHRQRHLRRMKLKRKQNRENETPEQREQRLKRERERYAVIRTRDKNPARVASRQDYFRKRYKNETAEQRSSRLQRLRQTYANKIFEESGETPDQRKRRLREQRASIKSHSIKIKKPSKIIAESAEEREIRLRKSRKYYSNVVKNKRRSILANETMEEREIRLKKQNAYHHERKKRKKLAKKSEKY